MPQDYKKRAERREALKADILSGVIIAVVLFFCAVTFL
jgi:hypothetical protein